MFSAALVLMLSVATATEQTVHLSPSVIELAGQPGQNTTQTLKLHNDTRMPLSFELVAQDVVVRGGKRVFVDAGSIPGSIAATAVFSPRTVTVPPGETRTAQVTVTLAPGAEHRAIIALFRGTTGLGQAGAARISLGTLLTFTISGSRSLIARPPLVEPPSAFSNVVVHQPFLNDGAEPVVAKGAAVILDARGAVVGRMAFEPRRLLPKEQLVARAEFPGELAPGTYRVVATFDYANVPLSTTAALEVR